MKKIFLLLCLSVCLFSYAQENAYAYTLAELQQKYQHENYTEKILLDFQKTMGNPDLNPQLHEYVPGDIIAWTVIYKRFAFYEVYQVQQDSLRRIEVKPKDTTFLNKLNSYVPEKSRFTYSSDLWTFPFVKEKQDDGSYLIKATLKSFNRQPDFPNPDILNYNLEYSTKDFEHFTLLRLKDSHTKEWIEVGNY